MRMRSLLRHWCSLTLMTRAYVRWYTLMCIKVETTSRLASRELERWNNLITIFTPGGSHWWQKHRVVSLDFIRNCFGWYRSWEFSIREGFSPVLLFQTIFFCIQEPLLQVAPHCSIMCLLSLSCTSCCMLLTSPLSFLLRNYFLRNSLALLNLVGLFQIEIIISS